MSLGGEVIDEDTAHLTGENAFVIFYPIVYIMCINEF